MRNDLFIVHRQLYKVIANILKFGIVTVDELELIFYISLGSSYVSIRESALRISFSKRYIKLKF